MKVHPLFIGGYVAYGTINGLNYIGFGKTHDLAIRDIFSKHLINTTI